MDIGIEIRGHRKKLLREIEQLPVVELDNNVPVTSHSITSYENVCAIFLSGFLLEKI